MLLGRDATGSGGSRCCAHATQGVTRGWRGAAETRSRPCMSSLDPRRGTPRAMTNNLPTAPIPRGSHPEMIPQSGVPLPGEFTGERGGGGLEDSGKVDWRRYWAAVLRYKWLVLLVAALGTAGGVAASRFIKPEYVAQATIWIEATQARGQPAGPNPIRAGNLLETTGWLDLLRSFVVLDFVVREQRLYLEPQNPQDSVSLAAFTLKERFAPGSYKLEVDESGRRFTLTAAAGGAVLQRGSIGDSVGASQGFLWAPPATAFRPGQKLTFAVMPPRDVARQIAERLTARVGMDGNFMKLELRGPHPAQLAA